MCLGTSSSVLEDSIWLYGTFGYMVQGHLLGCILDAPVYRAWALALFSALSPEDSDQLWWEAVLQCQQILGDFGLSLGDHGLVVGPGFVMYQVGA